MIFKTLGSLAFIVGLLFGLAFLAKRYFRPEKWGLKITGIRVVQSLPLDTKKKLMIVEVENQRLLIGVGQDSIQTLAELDPVDQFKSTMEPTKEVVYAQATS